MVGVRLRLAIAAILALTACQDGNSPTSQITGAPGSLSAQRVTASTVVVLNSFDQPISGARVLVGSREGAPFAGNLVITGSDGQARFTTNWRIPQPVTVDAPGHVRLTVFDVPYGEFKVRLRQRQKPFEVQVNGNVSGYGRLTNDGFLDVGLVLMAVQRKDLLSFDITSLISPEDDRISVLPGVSVDVPSNVSLPDQRESYGLPIRISKPRYRLFTPGSGRYRLVAIHGRAPFRKTVDTLSGGGSILDALNEIQFLGAGFQDVALGTTPKNENLVVDTLKFSPQIRATAPAFPAGHEMLTAPMIYEDGYLFPTDAKRLRAGETAGLTWPDGKPRTNGLLLSLLTPSQSGNEGFSAVVGDLESGGPVAFVPVIAAPAFSANRLRMTVPDAPRGVRKTATYALRLAVNERRSGQSTAVERTPDWDVFANDWRRDLEMPEFPGDGSMAGKYRWEISFVGDEMKGAAPATPGPEVLESATHVTRNAVDIP